MQSISSLHIIGGKGLGGAEMFFIRLVNALSALGLPVATITSPASPIDEHLGQSVHRYHVPMLGVWDLASQWRIRQIVNRTRPDIVQSYLGRATRLTHLPRSGGATHVARLGGYYGIKGYRHAHAWVGNTKGVCDYLIGSGLAAERVYHIGNFVDLSPPTSAERLQSLSRAFDLPDGAWVILGLGRLHPAKGFEDLLRALSVMPDKLFGRTLYLVMVGDGPLASHLRSAAHGLGVAERVRWAGWRNDTSAFFHRADLFVCPSREEPLGNVILEAWAHGCPTVCTRTCGPAEFATHGENCWMTPVGDPGALADGIRLLLGNPSKRKVMADRARVEVETRHAQAMVLRAYLSLYADLLEHGPIRQ